MKKFIAIILVFTMILSLSACTAKAPEQPAGEPQAEPKEAQITTVHIAGLKGPSSMGMIQMFEQKPMLKEGFETEYESLGAPDNMVAKILNKEVDIAALPLNVAAKLYNKGSNYKLLAVNTLGVMYILHAGDDIKAISDLKGKTIYNSAKGSTPDIALRYLLKKNNIDESKDITIDYTLGHAELSEAVAAGKVTTALLPEPFVTSVLMKNPNVKIAIDIQKEWKEASEGNVPLAMTGIVVNGEFADKNPEVILSFMEEYKKSVEFVNTKPAEAGVLIEKHGLGFKAKAAETAIPRCNIVFFDAEETKSAASGFFSILNDFSPADIGGKLPDENFYYNKK